MVTWWKQNYNKQNFKKEIKQNVKTYHSSVNFPNITQFSQMLTQMFDGLFTTDFGYQAGHTFNKPLQRGADARTRSCLSIDLGVQKHIVNVSRLREAEDSTAWHIVWFVIFVPVISYGLRTGEESQSRLRVG